MKVSKRKKMSYQSPIDFLNSILRARKDVPGFKLSTEVHFSGDKELILWVSPLGVTVEDLQNSKNNIF